MKNNIKFTLLIIIILLASLSIISAQHKFYVNLNDRADDQFKVTVEPEKLTEQNKIFQFAATAPGTYQIMDIGRYVKNFMAFDKDGKEIPVKNISLNQWEISSPADVKKIEYSIAETWDTKMEKNPVYPMCGTSIENDHALINGHCVFGYFHGMQKYPIKIKIDYPAEWAVGTALNTDINGYYDAPDFDYVVDSPILLGQLSKASTKINDTVVDIYTYSKTGMIKSSQLLLSLEDMLQATSQFTNGLPVDRYVFQFHFENFSAGAWEHNYSSTYVFKEDSLTGRFAEELRSTAAHEFFHIITPLHIHSELVENFNYEKPVMSQHLWLYEGVTEWASDILQLRDYLISLDQYLNQLRQKLTTNDNFDQSLSLTELGINSTDRQDQYINIYNKGAVVATLLDIRLLELSKGKRGLRELILDLSKKYGKNKSFSEVSFFDEIIKATNPEIRDFINNYISGAQKLPVKDYFNKIGIAYTESAGFDSTRISLGFGIGFKDNQFIITNVDSRNGDILQPGDIMFKVGDEEITMQNIQKLATKIFSKKIGEPVEFIVKRDGMEVPVKLIAGPREIRHQFSIMEHPTPEQTALRNAWLQNFLSYKGNTESH